MSILKVQKPSISLSSSSTPTPSISTTSFSTSSHEVSSTVSTSSSSKTPTANKSVNANNLNSCDIRAKSTQQRVNLKIQTGDNCSNFNSSFSNKSADYEDNDNNYNCNSSSYGNGNNNDDDNSGDKHHNSCGDKNMTNAHSCTASSTPIPHERHQSPFIARTPLPVSVPLSPLFHVPSEPYDPPTCLELLHRLCVGPASAGVEATATPTLNGDRWSVGEGGEGVAVGGRSTDRRSSKEREYSRENKKERGRDRMGTEESNHSRDNDTNEVKHENYHCDISSAEYARKRDGSSLYPHTNQSDCDISQKIGFTKQLEFIYKLTDLVDKLRFIDRPLRGESLCSGLAKLNESPDDLGVSLTVYMTH